MIPTALIYALLDDARRDAINRERARRESLVARTGRPRKATPAEQRHSR
jgi:hypothetical protein